MCLTYKKTNSTFSICFLQLTHVLRKVHIYRTSGNKKYKCFLLWTHHKGPRAFVSDNTQSVGDTHLYVYVMYTQVCAYQSFRILPFLRVEKYQHIYKKKEVNGDKLVGADGNYGIYYI